MAEARLTHARGAVTESQVASRFRFVTYNIRKGKGASGRLDGSVDELGRALASHKLDVVLCQEVFHGRTRGLSQSTQIAKMLGLETYYEPNRRRRVGHHGNATFTRFPVAVVENHDISTNPLERRGVLYIGFELEGTTVHVFNAHLGLNQRQRLTQVRRIGEIIAGKCGPDDPVVLAGDFNDWNRRLDNVIVQQLGFTNTFAHVKGKESLTWHSRRPVFNLDRVYVRNLQARRAHRLHGAPWDVLSDHLPLWVELELLGARG